MHKIYNLHTVFICESCKLLFYIHVKYIVFLPIFVLISNSISALYSKVIKNNPMISNFSKLLLISMAIVHYVFDWLGN